MNKTRLFALLTLAGLTLSGCSNSTDTIIEDAKYFSWSEGMTYEDRFNYVIEYLEDEVIVLEFDCDAKENYERYDGWTLKRVHNLFVALSQYILDSTDLHNVTVYVEYYMGGERIALGEITTRDNDLTLD